MAAEKKSTMENVKTVLGSIGKFLLKIVKQQIFIPIAALLILIIQATLKAVHTLAVLQDMQQAICIMYSTQET